MEERIIRINKRFGGRLEHPSNLMFDIEQAKRIANNPFKRNAYVIRGIVIGHPFSDANKRTATYFVTQEFKMQNYKYDEEMIVRGIKRIAEKGTNKIPIIEGKLRKWYTKK